MSNRRYYERRAAGLCPQCGVDSPDGVYCRVHREQYRARVAADRATDREGYNQYMRVYKADQSTILDVALALVDETNPRHVRERAELERERHAETQTAAARTAAQTNRAPVRRGPRGRSVRADSTARPPSFRR